MNEDNRKLAKGITIILMANIFNMIIGLLTGFILPKFLSVDSYAQIKTFQLYLTMVGLFHLGYSDGVYLYYGGKKLDEIDKNEFCTAIGTMRVFQILVCVILLIISVLIKNQLVFLFAIDLFSYNLIDFYKRIFQAVGEYNKYAHITNYVTILNFSIQLILLFVVKTDNAYYYIIGYLITDIIIFISLENQIRRNIIQKTKLFSFDFQLLVRNVKEGILLLFGNFTSIILTSMDRWFTKLLLTTLDFAQYSFAVSVENFLNVAITPITITLYNYLCKNPGIEKVKLLRKYITIFSVVLVSGFFPVKLILEVYLTKYLDSVIVISLLFASQIFCVIIKSIYINMYKARFMQKKYFIKVLIVIIVGFLFNSILFVIYPKKESFAFGTLCSAIVWFVVCILDFKELRPSKKEIIYLVCQLFCFLICSMLFEAIIGLCLYIALTMVITIALMKTEFIRALKILRRIGFKEIIKR